MAEQETDNKPLWKLSWTTQMSITLMSRKYTSIELNDTNIENKKIDKLKYNPN